MTALNATDIVAANDTSNNAIKYRFNGTGWESLGGPFNTTLPSVVAPVVAALNSTDFVVVDGFNDAARIYRFDGFTTPSVTPPFPLAGTVGAANITALNGTDIVGADPLGDYLEVYEFGFAPGEPHHLSVV